MRPVYREPLSLELARAAVSALVNGLICVAVLATTIVSVTFLFFAMLKSIDWLWALVGTGGAVIVTSATLLGGWFVTGAFFPQKRRDPRSVLTPFLRLVLLPTLLVHLNRLVPSYPSTRALKRLDTWVGAFTEQWAASALSTVPADRLRTEAAVTAAYRGARLRPPAIRWVSSPVELVSLLAKEQARSQLPLQKRRAANAAPTLGSQWLLFHTGPPGRDFLQGLGVWRGIWQAAARAGKHPAQAIPDPFQELAGLALRGASADILTELAGLVPLFALRRGIAVLVARPRTASFDDQGRLHNTAGPAVCFPDGWAIWAIAGVSVDRNVVDNPSAIYPAVALGHPNAEVRRILIEQIGYERLVSEFPQHRISDEFGTLWRIPAPDEALTLVEVANATTEPDGTRRRYFLRVSPDVQTPREAVAWTFGIDPDEYSPLYES